MFSATKWTWFDLTRLWLVVLLLLAIVIWIEWRLQERARRFIPIPNSAANAWYFLRTLFQISPVTAVVVVIAPLLTIGLTSYWIAYRIILTR